MSHLDDDALAALALGDGNASEAEHAAVCVDCSRELESLRTVLMRAQATPAGIELTAPPESVWQAITAEIAADRTQQAPATDDLGARRASRTRRLPLLAAAAAGVLVGGVGVGAALTIGPGEDQAQVVAQAPLTDLASEAPAGEVVLETRPDGTRVLVVDAVAPQVEDAYLEVWLIDEQIDGMVSLGHLADGTGEFVIPDGFDVSDFPIVDISVEPLDGVPTHSGESVTRGVLDA